MKTSVLPEPIAIPIPRILTGPFNFTPVEAAKKSAAVRLLPKENLSDLLEWTMKCRPLLGPSRPFDIKSHLYLVEIYQCKAKEIVVQKGSQLGISEWLISYAIHVADQRSGNILYLLPTSNDTSDFSTSRLGPALEASPYLSSIVIDGSGQGGMRGSDRITLKRIRDRFLYFRGSQVGTDGKASALKSIPVDAVIFDEVDELDPRAPAIAKKRLGHAKEDVNVVLWASTPSYPGVGIHEQFLESSQQRWFIKCEHCGESQSLEIEQVIFEWDDLGKPAEWHGKDENRAWVACKNCGKELNRLADGEWVAEYPEREKVGFHLTKLHSAQNPLIQVVKDLDTVNPDKLRETYNQQLGLPYTPRGGSLDSERLDACKRQYGHGPDYHKTVYCGIDVGTRVLHIVMRTLADFETGETKQIYAGETTWEHLPNLIKIYRPRVICCDALPETTKAREFQNSMPRNMVWLCYYPNFVQGSKKEENMVWNPKERTVLLDRTRVLDDTLAGFYGMTSTLPVHARHIPDYYKHMMASIRVTKEDASGQLVTRYVEVGADHYLHSEAYCYAASKARYGQGWVEPMGS